jgi:hypothetical protein
MGKIKSKIADQKAQIAERRATRKARAVAKRVAAASKKPVARKAKRAAAVGDANVSEKLHRGKRWTFKTDYENAGQQLTGGAQRSNDINYAVESGECTTFNALVTMFGSTEKLYRNIGYNVSNGRWTLNGYSSAGTLKRSQRDEQTKRGRAIVSAHGGKTINVVKERVRCGELA